MKRISLFMLGFLVLLVPGALAYTIEPGENVDISCDDFCVNGTLGLACTYSDSCPECEIVNESAECPTVRIERDLAWNETFKLNESGCDLNLYCEDMNISKVGLVDFPMDVILEKDENNSVHFYMEIRDRVGRVIQTWENTMRKDDVIQQKFRNDFLCPAELNTEVNLATCGPYLQHYLNVSDPMLFQLISGQTVTLEKLVECQGMYESNIRVAGTWENKFENCGIEKENLEKDLDECIFNANQAIEEQRIDYTNYANAWMYSTFALLLIAGIGFIYMYWMNNRFEGGA